MSLKPIRRKCLCCRRAFTPDYRNVKHQRFCSNPSCQRTRQVASQRRWRRQADNRDHFRGPNEVRRVQAWRQSHPGYWKQTSPPPVESQPIELQGENPPQSSRNVPPLQNVCLGQNPSFIGLLSMVTGSTLQNEIEATARQLLCRGLNILGLKVPEPTINPAHPYDRQTSDSTGAVAPDTQRV